MPQLKKFYKTNLPKMGILIKNIISKFSITNNQTTKRPPNFQNIKTYIRRPQIKKFYKTDPPKVGILIQIQFQNFQKPKIKLKKSPPKVPKNQKNI